MIKSELDELGWRSWRVETEDGDMQKPMAIYKTLTGYLGGAEKGYGMPIPTEAMRFKTYMTKLTNWITAVLLRANDPHLFSWQLKYMSIVDGLDPKPGRERDTGTQPQDSEGEPAGPAGVPAEESEPQPAGGEGGDELSPPHQLPRQQQPAPLLPAATREDLWRRLQERPRSTAVLFSDDGAHAIAEVSIPTTEENFGKFHFEVLPTNMAKFSLTKILPGAGNCSQRAWKSDGDETVGGETEIKDIHIGTFLAVPVSNICTDENPS